MTDKSRLWPSASAPSPVSRRALLAAMPKRDLAREAELTRKAKEMAARIEQERANG